MRLRVIPHPVFASEPGPPGRRGATVLGERVVRPYKRLADTIAAVAQVLKRGCSSWATRSSPVNIFPRRRRSHSAEWRLGYASEADIDRALGGGRSPSSRTRPRSMRAGHSCARSSRDPLSRMTSVGRAEPSAFRGRPRGQPGEVEALAEAIRELLSEPEALESARAGARRARGGVSVGHRSGGARLAVRGVL